MIKAIVSDFSRVLLFPKDENYSGTLNGLHKKLTIQENYDFFEYFQLNQELLDFYATLNEKIGLYMFTSEYIQEDPAILPQMNLLGASHRGIKRTFKQLNFRGKPTGN